MAKVKKADIAKIRLRVGDRTLTLQEARAELLKNPEQASKQFAARGVTVVASTAVLDWLQTILGAENVGDDGTVAPQMAGEVVALIVIAVVCAVGGFAVGYEMGYEDGEAAAQSSDEDGSNGDDDDGAGSGGSDGGETGGDTVGDGDTGTTP
jgi:hypothetical protein